MVYKKFFSKKIILVVLLTLVVFGGGFWVLKKVVSNKEGMMALVVSKVLVHYTNEERQINDIGELQTNPLLEEAARLKAEDMIANGYFAHNSPDGHTPWYWLDKVGYNFSYAGENLAVNFTESKDVNDAWMNSQKHRENILNGKFTEVGIAVVDGLYKGKMTTFVVQFFGKPAKKAFAETKPETKIDNTEDKTISVNKEEPKVSTTASSTVLGASGEKVIYTSFQNEQALDSKKSFWDYFIPTWLHSK